MEALTASTLLAAVVYVVINTIKYATAQQWRAFGTQLLVFAGGTFVTVVAAHSTYAAGISWAGKVLAQTNGYDQLLLGLVVGSIATTADKAFKAFDNSQTAAVPALGEKSTT